MFYDNFSENKMQATNIQRILDFDWLRQIGWLLLDEFHESYNRGLRQ